MATAQITYVVSLNTDANNNLYRHTFSAALLQLQQFLAANNGSYIGKFTQNGEEHDGYAVVKMTPAVEKMLHDQQVRLLREDGKSPYIARLEGECFDICQHRGMKIHPVFIPNQPECTT